MIFSSLLILYYYLSRRYFYLTNLSWSNFARTGNPNDETGMSGTYYSKNYPNEKMENLPSWKTFSDGDSGWFEISSHDNTDFKFTSKFHTDDCEFWDSLDLYAK